MGHEFADAILSLLTALELSEATGAKLREAGKMEHERECKLPVRVHEYMGDVKIVCTCGADQHNATLEAIGREGK